MKNEKTTGNSYLIMSNSTIVIIPLPLMSSLFHNDGIKYQINEFLGNEVMNMLKKIWMLSCFVRNIFGVYMLII